MKTFEEKWTAWIDGELTGAELAEFEASLPDKAAAETEKRDARKLGTFLKEHLPCRAMGNEEFFHHQLRERMADDAGRSARDEEPPVGIRLRQDGREVPVADGERARQPVVEGQVLRPVVGDRLRARGDDEPVVGPVVPGAVTGVPALGDPPVVLAQVGGVVRAYPVAGGVGVRVERETVGAEPEPVAPAEHPEVVVEGVVLHHQHDDVLDGRQRVGAGREVGERERARRRQGARAGAGAGCDPGAEPGQGTGERQARSGGHASEKGAARVGLHGVVSPFLPSRAPSGPRWRDDIVVTRGRCRPWKLNQTVDKRLSGSL